jgi:hypothetical protein
MTVNVYRSRRHRCARLAATGEHRHVA